MTGSSEYACQGRIKVRIFRCMQTQCVRLGVDKLSGALCLEAILG
jgi:hypothetical protein